MRLPAFHRLLVALLVISGIALVVQTPAFAKGRQAAQQNNSQHDHGKQPPNGYAITVTVPVVNVNVIVTDDNGNFLTGLKKDNFRITENGVPQEITNFSTGDAPITVDMLLEYSRLGYGWFLYNARDWADLFLRQLRPTDWVAVQSFSMRPKIQIDFTHNRREVEQVLSSMVLPTFSEANLFDAVLDSVNRMEGVHGRKAILLLASGLDTFSRHNLGQVINRLRETDVTIFCVGVGEELFVRADVPGGMGGTERLEYLQAKNELNTFAAMTGGRAYFPRFQGEIPGIMSDIAASLRNQYSLAYTPTDQKMDGKFRKIRVQLVAPDGGPLKVLEKGKKVKVYIYAREGYTAPKSNIAK